MDRSHRLEDLPGGVEWALDLQLDLIVYPGIVPTTPVRRPFGIVAFVTVVIGLTGCGASTPSSSGAGPAATATATAAATGVSKALAFTAPLVGGGSFDGATIAGRPVVFWFWAPT